MKRGSSVKPLIWLLRKLLYYCIEWPLVMIFIGIWVRHRHRMPRRGPAMIIANHNIAVIRTLCYPRVRAKLRPVGAADYFLSNRWMRWFSLNLLRIIPMQRNKRVKPTEMFQPIDDALAAGEVVILFPEGSRGQPEQMAECKRGIAHLAQRNPDVPVIPIFLHGLGKALPRGEALLVPIRCDAVIGLPILFDGDREKFMDDVRDAFDSLKAELPQLGWIDNPDHVEEPTPDKEKDAEAKT